VEPRREGRDIKLGERSWRMIYSENRYPLFGILLRVCARCRARMEAYLLAAKNRGRRCAGSAGWCVRVGGIGRAGEPIRAKPIRRSFVLGRQRDRRHARWSARISPKCSATLIIENMVGATDHRVRADREGCARG